MCNATQKKLCNDNCEICFSRSFASHSKSEFWSSLNEKVSRQFFKNSKNKVFFDCDKCNHQFESSLNNVNKGGVWCPFCKNKKLCKEENCTICFNKSFASHSKSEFWSSLNELTPIGVFKHSHKKYLFDCTECDHHFESSLNDVNKNHWCPFCKNKKLCEEENCTICFNKSFASHPKSEFWSSLNKLTPRRVFKGSDNKYLFHCNECNHQFEAQLVNVSNDQWCSYCSNKLLCNDNNCTNCFNKSFASHLKSKFWSSLNGKTPRGVFKSARNKFFFDCDKCNHQFETRLSDVNSGTWCPKCVNKTELIIYNYLLELHTEVNREVSFNWCSRKRFDFVIPDLNLIIELDGCAHFQQVSNWASHEETRVNDIYKMKCAFDNEYSIIRIQQAFVFADKLDWKDMLNSYIKSYKNPTVIFIGDRRYHQHIIDIDFTENTITHLI